MTTVHPGEIEQLAGRFCLPTGYLATQTGLTPRASGLSALFGAAAQRL